MERKQNALATCFRMGVGGGCTQEKPFWPNCILFGINTEIEREVIKLGKNIKKLPQGNGAVLLFYLKNLLQLVYIIELFPGEQLHV